MVASCLPFLLAVGNKRIRDKVFQFIIRFVVLVLDGGEIHAAGRTDLLAGRDHRAAHGAHIHIGVASCVPVAVRLLKIIKNSLNRFFSYSGDALKFLRTRFFQVLKRFKAMTDEEFGTLSVYAGYVKKVFDGLLFSGHNTAAGV